LKGNIQQNYLKRIYHLHKPKQNRGGNEKATNQKINYKNKSNFGKRRKNNNDMKERSAREIVLLHSEKE